MPLDVDDPAKGLTFNMTKMKYELCYSRGKQMFTFECKRDPLDLVYQGLDLYMPKAILDRGTLTVCQKQLKCPGKTLNLQLLIESPVRNTITWVVALRSAVMMDFFCHVIILQSEGSHERPMLTG
jgi:hypothetical protein